MDITRTGLPIELHNLQNQDVNNANAAALDRMEGASPVNDVNPADLAPLKAKLETLFEPHRTEENREALDALIHDRAVKLREMGETPETIEAMLDKAARMDRVTAPLQGAVGSAPFAAASVILDKVPEITAGVAHNPALTGFVASSFSGAMDAVGGGLLERATHDTFWLKPPPETLEPVMQQALSDKKDETRARNAGESALSWQTFTGRNAARLIVAGAVNATLGPKAAAAADTTITSVGGLAAGAGYAHLMNKNDLQAHRAGPAFLLGRTDWQEQYQALRESSTVSTPMMNGAKRAAKLPLDIITDTTKSLSKAVSFDSMVSNAGVLGGGFALTSLARDAARGLASRNGMGPGTVAAVDHTVNLGMSALTFGAYGVAGVATEPASEAAVKVLQEDVPAKASEVTNAVLAVGQSTVNTIREEVPALVRSAATTARELRDRALEHRRLGGAGDEAEAPV